MYLRKGVSRFMDRLIQRMRAKSTQQFQQGNAIVTRARVHNVDLDYRLEFDTPEAFAACQSDRREVVATTWRAVKDKNGRWHAFGNQDKLLSQLTMIRLAGELDDSGMGRAGA